MGKNFFKIQDVKDSDSEKLEDFLKNAQKELSVFFGIGVRLPSVFLFNLGSNTMIFGKYKVKIGW